YAVAGFGADRRGGGWRQEISGPAEHQMQHGSAAPGEIRHSAIADFEYGAARVHNSQIVEKNVPGGVGWRSWICHGPPAVWLVSRGLAQGASARSGSKSVSTTHRHMRRSGSMPSW